MDERTIIEGLAYISLAVGERLTEERTAVYVEQLRDLGNDHAWAQAVVDLAGHVEGFPKIPAIREAYRAAAARQPQREALSEGNETEVQERARFEWQAAQARKILDMLDANGGSLVRDMNAPGQWPTGDWRRKNCIDQPYSHIVYSDPEPPGGISPTRRPPFGDRS